MFFLDWVSCETFSDRVSRSLDNQLAWHEKPAYYFRLALCLTSRRFRKQMYALEEIAKKRGRFDNDSDFDEAVSNSLCLDADAKSRLHESLSKELRSS